MTETKRGGLALHWLMLIGFAVGLIGGLLVNLAVGADAAWVVWLTDNVTGPIGQIFLRLLFMMVIPLLFSALVLILFGRPWRHRMPRHDWWVVARYGMTLGMMNMLFYLALETIPFGIAVAIEFCGPLSVALFASRRPIDFVWIGCTVAGLLMLLPIWHGGGDAAGAQAMAEGAQGVVPGVA